MTIEPSVLETEAAAPAPQGTRRWVLGLLAGAAVASLIAAAALGFLLVRTLGDEEGQMRAYVAEEAPQVQGTSERLIELFLNYDATNIDRVAEELQELSTGDFREQNRELLNNLAPALEGAGASSRGRLLDDPDVTFRSPSEAVTIARVTQTAQTAEDVEGRTIDYVLRIMLVKTADEGWKADRVEILSSTQLPDDL